MKMSKWFLSVILTILFMLTLGFSTVEAKTDNSDSIGNRFNVVIVLDASNSMKYTDPSGLRFEAINQFVGLLAEQGNVLGGVVFSSGVEEKTDLVNINTKTDKLDITNFFEASKTYKYTNIGAGLEKAVGMIQTSGNENLPSAIIFLSDGNTEMPSKDELTKSLDTKAGAIQTARDSSIPIYSICLNANGKADVGEMEQISKATGGVFEEVKVPDDLKDVLNDFYDMIYGTSTIHLADKSFPSDGIIKVPFEVPGIGVEEVNILINGKMSSIKLMRPDGTESAADQTSITSSDTFSMVKLKEIIAGKWMLVLQGNSGDQIKINMVYNTDLAVLTSSDPQESKMKVDEEVIIKGQLAAGDTIAEPDQYGGYTAKLEVLDKNEKILDTKDMELTSDGFQASYAFSEGVFYYRVVVNGYSLTKVSEKIGPITINKNTAPENTAPAAVESVVEKKVTIWPFKGGSFELDLNTLAKDKEDSALDYQIISSSYLEGTDYTVKDHILKQSHFSLSKGSYTVRAVDSGGLSCDIEVKVVTYNVGLIALIGIGIAVLIGLLIFAFLLWIALTKPFGGAIIVQGYANGEYSKKIKKEPRRGRCKLSLFDLKHTGLNYRRCYFQATGKNYIELVTNIPVYYDGRKTNRVRIENGTEVMTFVDEENTKRIYIRFESRRRNRSTKAARNRTRQTRPASRRK